MTILKTKSFQAFLFFAISISFLHAQQNKTGIPINNSKQIIVVLTDSPNISDGVLFRLERNKKSDWEIISKPIPIIIGKNGFAVGKSLIPIDKNGMGNKVEGDGKSPAGVFTLTKAFGFAPEKKLKGLKIPYIQVTNKTECVDDPKSKFYNQIVRNNEVDTVDWNSSEKMWKADPWYRFGVFVDNNCSPVEKGKGSCIFLHNWDGPADSTVGCTAMAPENMKTIVFWLDAKKNPMLIQLTNKLYDKYKNEWGLPELEPFIQRAM
jgi:D-alanyl-D-alanine dipeptidase